MKQGLTQWSTTLAKGMGVSALAMAMAACTGGTTSSSSEQQTQSSAPVITSSANNVSSAPVVTSSSMATASSTPSLADDDVAIVANYDGNIPLLAAKGRPGAPLQTDGNPFQDSYFYLSPDIKTMMDYSLEIAGDGGAMTDKIKYVQHQPSAIWMDSTATIGGDIEAGRRSLVQHLDAAVAQQNYYAEQDGQISPMTVVVIVYNLPDRDCAAFASNGKLYEVGKPQDPMPNDGMARYRDEYLGQILDAFQAKPEFANLRLVAMLEPDSYPNMITNTDLNPDGPALTWPALTSASGETYCDSLLTKYSSPGLESGLGVYGHGLQIAIEELAKIDNTYTYLDIAHAGWLGWDGNLERGVEGFIKLIAGANTDGISGFSKVRGFASNTSGYTPLEEPAISNADGDKMDLADFYEWNSAVDEMTYIDRFNAAVKSEQPGFNPGFIIDTARNGWGRPGRPTPGSGSRGTNLSDKVDLRAHRGHWCNVDKAGVGETSKASPDSSRPHLDAFFWMKPPGEADGISFDVKDYPKGGAAYNALDAVDKEVVDSAANPIYEGKALDTMCIPGSIRDGDKATEPMPFLSPHAGGWFHKQFIELINNAYPPLGTSDY
ncbi:glycoside hydrolase family 6 protein [Marinagarivorans cellulosilyticus]|uniref:Glucanase n=1 Tax=Marinagarivorans cellulosilyticus TaxID=2721545 RepID=A0AAN1WH23_9GAMM|nr:glycoside hydrolase family 6 protein [Marinagarivorans cellulosilyticus]BCD97467.1 cellulose 1,4-beta-cellobiosidase [Marinagarivorans cellulosilyticus]